MTSYRSSRVVLPEATRPSTVRIEDGAIVEIGIGTADHDFGDLVILPGLVDSHVHVNEPGRTEWEGFATATRAAAAGGATTIVDMPLNSIPPTTTLSGLEAKRAAASGRISVDVGFWGGIVPGSEGEVGALTEAGVCGFKVFLADSGVPEYPPMEAAAVGAMGLDLPLLVHAETPKLLGDPGPSYPEYLASRPPEAEADAIRNLAGVAGPVHILHVSSSDGVGAIAASGNTISGETCPHYLTFTDSDVTGVEFKCAPPIRDRSHREALWEGLDTGALTMIVSDHSPSPPDLKLGDFATAWGGISSLQLRLPATFTEASLRGHSWDRLAGWLATAPARLAGLDDRKGSINIGHDGDLVVFDPDAVTNVRGRDLFHRHPITPYEGRRLRGAVVATVLGGVVVYGEGAVVEGRGRMLTRR